MNIVALTSVLMLAPIAASAQTGLSATMPRESTDIYIRRLAGLPASSANGEIEIVDVGHFPLDTMLSIVARRGPAAWHVSYACAASPHCSKGADHLALDYDIGDNATQRVDAILVRLKTGSDPGGTRPSSNLLCGNLSVAIDYKGFQQTYSRTCSWGPTLGDLETLLKPANSIY